MSAIDVATELRTHTPRATPVTPARATRAGPWRKPARLGLSRAEPAPTTRPGISGTAKPSHTCMRTAKTDNTTTAGTTDAAVDRS